MLVIHIAHTEDAARYQCAVRFWNSQLNEVLGFRSPKSLNNARQKAVACGWLHYERDNDRTVGYYWTIIPKSVLLFNDEPIEPSGTVPSTERENGTVEELHGRFGNGKENHCGTGNDLPSIPVPVPVPKTHSDEKSSDTVSVKSKKRKTQSKTMAGFDQWYALYPKKVGRGDAEKAYPKAIADIQATDSLDASKAVAELLRLTQERLPSLNAIEPKYRKHPATWLNAKRYRDELGTTRNDDHTEYLDLDELERKKA